MKRIALGAILVLCILFLLVASRQASAPTYKVEPPTSSQPKPEASFNKQAHPIDQLGSLWLIVSKVAPLNPIDYAPDDLATPHVSLRTAVGDSQMRLRQEATGALEKMFAAAKQENINLMLTSGYQSYQLQVALYNAAVQKSGQAGADQVVPRPGTSENQTGLAADIEPTSETCELQVCFADTAEGKWLAANAYKYGFIIRYPENKTAVTGYQYEPWHVRYVGINLSLELEQQHILTLEEFFGIVPDHQPY